MIHIHIKNLNWGALEEIFKSFLKMLTNQVKYVSWGVGEGKSEEHLAEYRELYLQNKY